MDNYAPISPRGARTFANGPGNRQPLHNQFDSFSKDAEHSVRSIDSLSISRESAISGGSSSRLPDFFGAEVFQTVLHNPTTVHQLVKFSQARFCGETMEFLEEVDKFHSLLSELTKTMVNIHRSYISPNAMNQINLSHDLMKRVHSNIKSTVKSTVPGIEAIFTDAQDHMENLVFTDIYPRFVRHKMTMSAMKAFSTNRGKYQGLGDCFCLTNPALADNPIVYASDGFVSVTGYPRSDVIPRNCRFLQGRHTDRQPVRRIRESIDAREESVEFLLNYKQNGEPFWNLLYIAPLFNADGNIIFFLGGQINCSSTIHSNSDIFRILSTSDDVDEERPTAVEPQKAPTSRFGLLKRFTTSNDTKNVPSREAGMETGLVNKIDGLDLKKQRDTFYTAYSKYLVVRKSTFVIEFYSAGISELFRNPAGAFNFRTAVGMDVFKFLSQNSSSSSKDYKSRVKGHLAAGRAISVDMTLMTGQGFSQEKFVGHWTPLKDENSVVTFVVLTLSHA